MEEETIKKLESKILFRLNMADYGEAIGLIGFLIQSIVLIYMIYSSRIPDPKDIILFLILTFMIGIGFYSFHYKIKIQDDMIDVILNTIDLKNK